MSEYADNDAVVAAIVMMLSMYGPADARGLAARIESVDGNAVPFEQLMLCIGMATGERKIVMDDPEQPWTGQWVDVRWKVA